MLSNPISQAFFCVAAFRLAVAAIVHRGHVRSHVRSPTCIACHVTTMSASHTVLDLTDILVSVVPGGSYVHGLINDQLRFVLHAFWQYMCFYNGSRAILATQATWNAEINYLCLLTRTISDLRDSGADVSRMRKLIESQYVYCSLLQAMRHKIALSDQDYVSAFLALAGKYKLTNVVGSFQDEGFLKPMYEDRSLMVHYQEEDKKLVVFGQDSRGSNCQVSMSWSPQDITNHPFQPYVWVRKFNVVHHAELYVDFLLDGVAYTRGAVLVLPGYFTTGTFTLYSNGFHIVVRHGVCYAELRADKPRLELAFFIVKMVTEWEDDEVKSEPPLYLYRKGKVFGTFPNRAFGVFNHANAHPALRPIAEQYANTKGLTPEPPKLSVLSRFKNFFKTEDVSNPGEVIQVPQQFNDYTGQLHASDYEFCRKFASRFACIRPNDQKILEFTVEHLFDNVDTLFTTWIQAKFALKKPVPISRPVEPTPQPTPQLHQQAAQQAEQTQEITPIHRPTAAAALVRSDTPHIEKTDRNTANSMIRRYMVKIGKTGCLICYGNHEVIDCPEQGDYCARCEYVHPSKLFPCGMCWKCSNRGCKGGCHKCELPEECEACMRRMRFCVAQSILTDQRAAVHEQIESIFGDDGEN